MFTWVPFYQEMAKWLLTMRYKQAELCGILREIGFTGNLDDQDDNGTKPLAVMDPFTFVAFFQKMGHEKRAEHLSRLKDKLGFKSPVPTDFNGLPSANPQKLWYFKYENKRLPDVMDTLWSFAEQVVSDRLDPDTFYKVLSYPGIRIAKLTHGMFFLNPTANFPVDAHKRYVEIKGIKCDVSYLGDYITIVGRVKNEFNKPLYEVSHDAWLYTKADAQSNSISSDVAKVARYWVYAPGENASKWDEFYSDSIIGLGWEFLGDLTEYQTKTQIANKLREYLQETSSKKNDAAANWKFCNDMNIGDFVFVKRGRSELIGFGKITSEYYFDDKAKDYNSRRKMNWLKKGSWSIDHSLAVKSLTDVTDYESSDPRFTYYYESLLNLINKPHMSPEEVETQFREYLDRDKNHDSSDQYIIGVRGVWRAAIERMFTNGPPFSIIDLPTLLPLEKKCTEAGIFGRNGLWPTAFNHYMRFCKSLASGELTSDNTTGTNSDVPLNSILYGPPGTGKTFSTIEKSIVIANPEFVVSATGDVEPDRKAVKAEFERLCADGRIVFTTFHQSMGYEEFIEGIKPETVSGNVTYRVKDGIFKTLCNRALFEYYKLAESASLKSYSSFDELYDLFLQNIEERLKPDKPLELPQRANGRFVNLLSIEDDDFLVQGSGSDNQVYVKKENLRLLYNRYAKIEDITNVVKDIRAVGTGLGWSSNYYGIFRELKRFEGTLKPNDIKTPSLGPRLSDEKISLFLNSLPDKYAIENIDQLNVDNFVLIIDEINRGNISQIFGELITLLEEDKRLGKPERIRVRLPYSGDDFIVPPNVHIIGTMNTADRSVEALDTALRRRFSFEEISPNPKLLTQKISGIALGDLLATMNERIEALIDRDHAIGHSFLYKLKNEDLTGLRNVFKDSVIPLLKEYFYGDYGKIALVLGKGFVKVEAKPAKVKFAIDSKEYEAAGDFESPKFEVSDIDEHFDIVGAIKQLMLIPISTPVAAELN